MRYALPIATLLTALLALPAAAGTRPGSWELHIKTRYTQGGPKMSAEELKMLREAGIDDLNNLTDTRCITPQQAREEFSPDSLRPDDSSGCHSENVKRQGNTLTADWVCEGGALQGRGTVRASYGEQQFQGTQTFSGTSSDPQMGLGAVAMQVDFSGRWLQAACTP